MEQQAKLPLIGEKALSFKVESTQGPTSSPDDFKGMKGVEVAFPVISDLWCSRSTQNDLLIQ